MVEVEILTVIAASIVAFLIFLASRVSSPDTRVSRQFPIQPESKKTSANLNVAGPKDGGG